MAVESRIPAVRADTAPEGGGTPCPAPARNRGTTARTGGSVQQQTVAVGSKAARRLRFRSAVGPTVAGVDSKSTRGAGGGAAECVKVGV